MLILFDSGRYPDVIRWTTGKLKNVCCTMFLKWNEKIRKFTDLEIFKGYNTVLVKFKATAVNIPTREALKREKELLEGR